jgi:hypothetical protein
MQRLLPNNTTLRCENSLEGRGSVLSQKVSVFELNPWRPVLALHVFLFNRFLFESILVVIQSFIVSIR